MRMWRLGACDRVTRLILWERNDYISMVNLVDRDNPGLQASPRQCAPPVGFVDV